MIPPEPAAGSCGTATGAVGGLKIPEIAAAGKRIELISKMINTTSEKNIVNKSISSRFYCEEILNIDFGEDKRKLPTKSFLKYSRKLSTYP